MIISLSETEYINSIMIVVNGSNPRMNSSIKKMLKRYYLIFGKDFLNHVAFIVTRWSYREDDIKDREEEGLTEDFKIEGINQELIELGIRKDSDKLVKVFFVNNKVGNSYKSEDNQKKMEVFELEQHFNFL